MVSRPTPADAASFPMVKVAPIPKSKPSGWVQSQVVVYFGGNRGQESKAAPAVVAALRKLGIRSTSSIIRQNLWFSLGVVAFLVPATILGLGIGPAVAVHEGSTVVVVFNALRLLAFRHTAPIARR